MPQADTDDPLRYGNYTVVRLADGTMDELGRGGFGRTFRARHCYLGTEAALKVITERLAFDEAARTRFLKEAREHARLDHPGIARIIDFGEKDGVPFYAMEICPDGDLKEYVKKNGPLAPAAAMGLILQAAEGLNHVHGRGILHLDIKPSNLLLRRQDYGPPQVKLTDFGLVKRMVQPEAMREITGGVAAWSAPFASPEQMREQELDERADIFSLGMTAWYLMTGRIAVDGAPGDIIAERLSEASCEPLLPASLTTPLREIVARMVEKNAARRYRSCAELLTDLKAALRAGPREAGTEAASLSQYFHLKPAGRNFAGEILRGHDRHGTPVRVTLLHPAHAAGPVKELRERAARLLASAAPGLAALREVGEFAEGWAVIEEERAGALLPSVLRREGAVAIKAIAQVLRDAAAGLDAAAACGLVPAALEMAMFEGAAAEGEVDWSKVRIRLALQWLAPPPEWTAGVEMTTLPALSSPIQVFAGLAYQMVSARQVRTAALHSVSACPPVPALSSEGNRVLAGCLAGDGSYTTCREACAALLTAENLPVEARAAGPQGATTTASRTAAGGVRENGAAATEAAAATTSNGAAVQRIVRAAALAKECARRLMQVKLPPGADDQQLSAAQVEAHRAAREISAFEQQARADADAAAAESLAVRAEEAAARIQGVAAPFAAGGAAAPAEETKAAERVHVLRPAEADITVTASATRAAAARPGGFRRWREVVAAVVCFAGLGVAAWMVFRQKPPSPDKPVAVTPAPEPPPVVTPRPDDPAPPIPTPPPQPQPPPQPPPPAQLPATIRLRSFQSLVPLPATLKIGGRAGTLEGNTLVFANAAESDGTFKIESPRWEAAGRAVRVDETTFEGKLRLVVQSVTLETAAGSSPPWTAVAFTPAETADLPESGELAEALGATEGAGGALQFPVAGPVKLPPGEYQVSWIGADGNRDGEPLTVEAGKEAAVKVP